MKTRDLIVAAGVVVLASSCGSTTTTTSATSESARAAVVSPPMTQTEFLLKYPTATNIEWSRYDQVPVIVDWELTGWPDLTPNDYVVAYTMDGRRYYGYYDVNGEWVGSTYVVSDFASLPSGIRNLLTSKYPGFTMTSVNTVIWKDHDAYQIELKNETNKVKMLVDMNGNILKEKTKML
jgi:hypothetical protein